ncbi:MAG: glycerophosphodiester phosphodiesterase family protein [Oscillospiraceae bacterium]
MVVLLAVLCLLAVAFFMLCPGKSTPRLRAPFWGRNYAHRGLHGKSGQVPENSLAAFAAAANAGYGRELDVQLSKDGQVVVFHDDTLDRVCGVNGRVDSFEYSELMGFRLHQSEQGIPLFTEVLNTVAGRVPLIVELKMGPRNAELCRKTKAILGEYAGPYCIESFDPRIVRWFKKNAPGVLRGQLASRPKELNSSLSGFLVGTLLCNFLGRPHFIAYGKGKQPFTVLVAKSLAMKVVWTVRPEDDIQRLEIENDAVIFEFYEPETQYKPAQQQNI